MTEKLTNWLRLSQSASHERQCERLVPEALPAEVLPHLARSGPEPEEATQQPDAQPDAQPPPPRLQAALVLYPAPRQPGY